MAEVGLKPRTAAAPPAFAIPLNDLGTRVITDDHPEPSGNLETGKDFHSRYTIEGELGRGGIGIVYLAHDKVSNQGVALKLVNPALVTSVRARERFIREGRIARDMRHKNIVAVYDVNEAEGHVYLVMEYLPGETLRSWVHRIVAAGKDIPFDNARQIIRNVLEGLHAAHAAGVIHRDLKPENIMLIGNPDDGDYRLKILDFGIPRAVRHQIHQQITTTTAASDGLSYLPPEQKTAADMVGPPADLYSVTAIFDELLLGVAPGLRRAALSKEGQDLTSEIDAIIEKGLSTRPQDRYQSAREYMTALDRVGVSDFSPKPPDHPAPQDPPGSPKSKSRAVVIVVAAILGLLLVSWIATVNSRPGSVVINSDYPAAINPKPAPPSSPPPPVNLAGEWFDELTGTGVAQARVIFQQNNNSVSGTFFNSVGLQAGTVSGEVDGNNLVYNYYSPLGSGSGLGALDADGAHLRILVNGMERHTLHRSHLPEE
jgi:serine/threonine protein kinase